MILMSALLSGGPGHRFYLRQIQWNSMGSVSIDFTARVHPPLARAKSIDTDPIEFLTPLNLERPAWWRHSTAFHGAHHLAHAAF